MDDLRDKACLVTGSSTGIGAAVARAAGGRAVVLAGDVSRPAVAHGLVEQTVAAFGRLDVLVNNAGGPLARHAFVETTDAIINTTSTAGRHGGGPGALVYAAAKAAVTNLTRGLAKERAPERIRVNAVSPGVILTPIHERLSTPEIQGFGNLNPVTLIRRALAACPDEVIAAGTSELAFVADTKLRDDLRIDISSVRTAVTNGEWKPATVIAGAVVEALLLWALQPHPGVPAAVAKLVGQKSLSKNPGPDLERWDLHDFIKVAADLGVIKPETAHEARLVKDYRNLIHPGRVARLQQKCDRGTAYFAVAALDHVIRDLTPP